MAAGFDNKRTDDEMIEVGIASVEAFLTGNLMWKKSAGK